MTKQQHVRKDEDDDTGSESEADLSKPRRYPATRPPQAPEVQKQFKYTPAQLVGVPLLMLIPILALFSVFGESRAELSMQSEEVDVTVEYPVRYRYKQINPMEIYVENISASTVPTVTVSVDTGYISSFSTVVFTPSPDEVTADVYIVRLKEVQPGERRLVTVQLQAEHYWQHEGTVAVQAVGGEPLEADVSTFIFP